MRYKLLLWFSKHGLLDAEREDFSRVAERIGQIHFQVSSAEALHRFLVERVRERPLLVVPILPESIIRKLYGLSQEEPPERQYDIAISLMEEVEVVYVSMGKGVVDKGRDYIIFSYGDKLVKMAYRGLYRVRYERYEEDGRIKECRVLERL
jgi:hypothetical protein